MMKVLVVDDEILVRKGISMGIDWQELGFEEVKEASNGLEALTYAKTAYPELVLTDIKMPKMDGLELIDALKKYCPDTIVIVLSCINDSEYIREAMKFNRALDYIPKLSMSTGELIEVIKRAKSYIKESRESQTQEVAMPETHIFNHQKEILLRDAIESNDLLEMKNIIQQCFKEAKAQPYSLEQFIDWHEIYALLSSRIKEHQGNMNTLHFENQKAYDYLRQSSTLDQMEARFLDILTVYIEELKLLKSRVFSKEINEAIAYINKNYQKPLKLTDIAHYVGMNESYISRLFKKCLNINFVDYLNHIRVNKAKELLIQQQLSVAEIAYQVGYQNESYFSRIFKAIEGVSPKQYAKK